MLLRLIEIFADFRLARLLLPLCLGSLHGLLFFLSAAFFYLPLSTELLFGFDSLSLFSRSAPLFFLSFAAGLFLLLFPLLFIGPESACLLCGSPLPFLLLFSLFLFLQFLPKLFFNF